MWTRILDLDDAIPLSSVGRVFRDWRSVPLRIIRGGLKASVPEYRRESCDGSRSGHRNSSMGSRDGTGRDADLPIRPGTACKGLKTQASQIPKRCRTSWEAVGIVFSSDSCDRSRRSCTPVYARRNGNGNSPTPLPDLSSVACEELIR